MQEIDYHVIKRSLSGADDECGDTGLVREHDNQCFMALIDALGHGKEAFDVAVLAERYLAAHYKDDLTALLKGLHGNLQGTRGAVAAACRLNRNTGILKYSGVGNISIKLFGSKTKRLITREGILGYMIPSPTESQVKLYPGDIFLMSSDGIREHFDLIDYPEILMGNARDISAAFIETLGKTNDDASCIALRYGI